MNDLQSEVNRTLQDFVAQVFELRGNPGLRIAELNQRLGTMTRDLA